MTSIGYSGTPLEKKLGIKAGFKMNIHNMPDHYFQLFIVFPEDVQTNITLRGKDYDMIHFFTKSEKELTKKLPAMKQKIVQNGSIWVSWPKKSSKVETDVTEDVIRDLALSIGLVDVKVCAVDEIWSGLKLVIPVKDRK